MTITVTTTISPRTFLECVQRVMGAVGDTPPATVVTPHSRTRLAMQSVNDAFELCFMAARWPWREKHMEIRIEEMVMWYTLPDDFGQPQSGPRANRVSPPLPYVPVEKLYEEHPEIRTAPTGTAVSTTTLVQHVGASYFGMPDRFTITGDSIGLFPVPDEDAVDEQPTWLMTYYRLPVEMVGDSDILDLPKYLWLPHHRIALGLMREALEYSDGMNTYLEGQSQLRNQIALHGLIEPQYEGTTGGINYNE